MIAKPQPDRRHVLCGTLLAAASIPLASTALARAVETPATEDDEKFMRLALEEAARGDFPFGAVIIREGKMLAKGRNLGIRLKDPTAHAEMVAIRRFLAKRGPEQIKETTLYATGEPCPMCMGAILWCRIPRVVYGASITALSAKIEQINVDDRELAEKAPFTEVKITGGVLAAEALALFK